MRSATSAILGLVVSALLITAAAAGQPSATIEGMPVRLGTATPGGGFQLFGQHLADVVNATDTGLAVAPVATRGSRENLALLERAEIDIGLVEGNAAHQALDGAGRPPANLRVLGVMYPNPGMFVVRADADAHGIDDLRGRAIAFGTRASGLRILATDVLDALGLSAETDFDAVILDRAGDGPPMVIDGSVAAFWGAGIGWPGFVAVAESEPGARFIAPSAGQIARILAAKPHLRRMAIPAGTYRGQDEAIESVGLWSLILVRPDLPDDLAYRLAAALHAGEAALAERLPQGAFATAANTVAEVPLLRLHPGALAYYRDAGLL
jgi:uncharacterized protein